MLTSRFNVVPRRGGLGVDLVVSDGGEVPITTGRAAPAPWQAESPTPAMRRLSQTSTGLLMVSPICATVAAPTWRAVAASVRGRAARWR